MGRRSSSVCGGGLLTTRAGCQEVRGWTRRDGKAVDGGADENVGAAAQRTKDAPEEAVARV
jgi:hypothetical protein